MIQLRLWLPPVLWGLRVPEIALAFERSPVSREARVYSALTLTALLTAVPLFLTAAVVDTWLGDRPLSETFGNGGLMCLNLCAILGLRYKALNGRESPLPASENRF